MHWTEDALLKLMFAEWNRPLADSHPFGPAPAGSFPSPRLMMVILYWSLFETLLTGLIERGTEPLPLAVSGDLFGWYS